MDVKSEGLLVKDLQYLRDYIIGGMTHPECYKRYNPKTIQAEANRGRSGSRVMRSIKEKVGSWADVFGLVGIGPEKVAALLHKAAEATKGGEPDHNVRIKVATLLMQIHGLTEQTINVKNEGPIPITYFYEQPRETKEPESDDETTDC